VSQLTNKIWDGDMIGLVTFSLLYMTVLSVFGRRRLPEGTDGVGILFAGLFSLPSMRSIMPGSPPFGASSLKSTP
jgi:hypothetical protein